MKAERYQLVKNIYYAACELPTDQREHYLRTACSDDHELRDEVLALFHVELNVDSFLDQPLVDGDRFMHGAVASLSEAESKPVSIGRYRIIRLIGEGGMGSVYEALQQTPQRRVAVKIIRTAILSKRLRERFQQEVEILGRLRHPGIAQIHDAGVAELLRHDGTTSNVPYFAMEYVDGEPLTAHARRARLTDHQRLKLLADVCDAVHFGHVQGVIHRDLKPANILVESSGQAKVIDFGVARATDSDVAVTTLQTEVGQILGTLAYMSPEQVSGNSRAVDARSDVYSLGVIGYELLSNRLPFDLTGMMVPQAARVIQESEPSRLSSISRVYRGDIETIIGKAIAREPERRYQSAAELATDIRRYLTNEPIVARPPTLKYQLGKFARRHKELVAGLTLVFLALVAGVIGTTIGMLDARQEQRVAQLQAIRATRVNDVLQRILSFAQPSLERGGRDVRVVEMLDAASEELTSQLVDVPDIEMIARQTLGETYARLGMYQKAEANLQRAWEIARDLEGDYASLTLGLRGDLAIYRTTSLSTHVNPATFPQLVAVEREELLPLLDFSLKESGPASPASQKLLLAVGATDCHQWHLHDAEKRFRMLLESLESLPPEEQVVSPVLVIIKLSWTLWCLRDIEEAEELARRACALASDGRPIMPLIESPPTGMLASILQSDYTKLDETERLVRETMAMQSNVLGPDHFRTIDTSNMLAHILIRKRQWEEARALFETQRHYYETNVPGSTWEAYLRSYEATLLVQQGRLEEAAIALDDACALYQRNPPGFNHCLIFRQRAAVQTGLQSWLPWRSEGLRQFVRSSIYNAVLEQRVECPTSGCFQWDQARFKLTPWLGTDVEASMAAIDILGVESLRETPEPRAGLYHFRAVVPRAGADPLIVEQWALFADWTCERQHAACLVENERVVKVTYDGPPEKGRLTTLAFRDWFEEGFGPGRQNTVFEIRAACTINPPPGAYRLIIDADDGIRAWIDDQLVIDRWERRYSRQIADVEFTGEPRELRIEYFQHGEDAQLWVRLEPAKDGEQ